MRRVLRAVLRRGPFSDAAFWALSRLRRPPADTVWLSPPSVSRSGRLRRQALMYRLGGRDPIAAAIAEAGWGHFEYPLPDVYLACLARASGLVIDVGANTGLYTLLAALASPSLRVHAFEPLPDAFDALRLNVGANWLDGRVEIFPTAVGAEAGEASFYVPVAGHSLVETSSSLRPGFKAKVTSIPVAVTTLDAHLRSRCGAGVAALKIDVEGFEHRVLMGAAELIRRDRPLIFLEILPNQAATAALEALRRKHEYLDVHLRPSGPAVRDRVSEDWVGWNHLWIPRERAGEWIPRVRAAIPGGASAEVLSRLSMLPRRARELEAALPDSYEAEEPAVVLTP